MNKYSINILISHPDKKPQFFTDELKLEPNLSQIKGEQIVTPIDRKINSYYRFNKWRYTINLKNNEEINDKLFSFVDYLYDYCNVLSPLCDEGGTVSLFLNFTEPEPLKFFLNTSTTKKLNEMNIQLGVEIFCRQHCQRR